MAVLARIIFPRLVLCIGIPGASAAGCSASSRDVAACGNALLQSSRTLDRRSSEPDMEPRESNTVAPTASNWLGWGHNIAAEDYWSFSNLGGESLFTRDMPGTCFEVAHCSQSNDLKTHQFASVDKWSSFYSSSFDLGLAGGYGGFSASVDASFGSSFDTSGEVLRNVSFAAKTAQGKCFRLVRDDSCAYNTSYLQPEFLSRLKSLPKGSPHTKEKMEAWKAGFIQRFGTHISMVSSHGASVQSLFSVDSRSEVSSACMDSSLCLKFGWLDTVGANFCSKDESCDSDEHWSSTETSTCTALGGDPQLRPRICQGDVTQELLDEWIQGGDLEAGSSIFRYSFMPVHDFLTNLGFEEFADAAAILKKAVEYSTCRVDEWPPVQRWQPGGQYERITDGSCSGAGMSPILDVSTCQAAARVLDLEMDVVTSAATNRPEGCYIARIGTSPEKVWLSTNSANQGKGAETSGPSAIRHPICMLGDFRCQCVRRCANGGILDAASCTCKCRGNLQHGWTGPECQDTYGSCQAGSGTGNPNAAERCVVQNKCDSWYSKRTCNATDVCCATNFGTTCCPFGSTCNCDVDSCKCSA